MVGIRDKKITLEVTSDKEHSLPPTIIIMIGPQTNDDAWHSSLYLATQMSP